MSSSLPPEHAVPISDRRAEVAGSGWAAEVKAIFAKELQSELRGRSGLVTVGFFSLVAVVAVALAAYNIRLSGSLAAGLLWVVLLFASTVSLPRAFVAEEEQGTADLLRLISRPHAVFWGKALYNFALMLITAAGVSMVFVAMVGVSVEMPGLYAASLLGGCASLAGAVTLCGALVAQASGRSALAGAVAIPLLLPLIAFAVASTRVALGEGMVDAGRMAALGLIGYGAIWLAIGPPLYASVWKS